LDAVADVRDPKRIVYPGRSLLWSGILLFATRLGSRRRLRFEFGSPAGIENLNRLAQTQVANVPHPDTLAYFLKRLPPAELSGVRFGMIEDLVRSRALEKFRLRGQFYMVAGDGTGLFTFHERHCEHCLTQVHEGQTVYYHTVLEMKLVFPNGLALSLATEFIENPDGRTKQDCELAAFYRLIPKLRQRFPLLPLCLLLDGLYLNQNVLRLLRKHRIHYIITFKEGSLPTAYSEFQALHPLTQGQTLRRRDGEIEQAFRWVNGLLHEGETFHAFECVETVPGENPTTFFWATDLPVTENNVVELSQQGGRCRWKIENEGFNTQKNLGYNLEHAYCEHETAAKNFYLLLQIAHLIVQLVEASHLFPRTVAKLFGSSRAFAQRLLEAFRNVVLSAETLRHIATGRYQVRFDTS
jgi:hypothetical protein